MVVSVYVDSLKQHHKITFYFRGYKHSVPVNRLYELVICEKKYLMNDIVKATQS